VLFLSIGLTGRLHREEEAFQQINTSGENLRGAAISRHLMIYSEGMFRYKTPPFWKAELLSLFLFG